MSKLRLGLIAAILIASALTVGCNSFEAVNQSLNETDRTTLVSEGNIALDEGRFAGALELFERAMTKGGANDATRRGRASALAGLGGFNLFSVLDIMQNGTIPGDSPGTIFAASSIIQDRKKLDEAVSELWQLKNVTANDRLLKSLLVSISCAREIVEKYDTNFNGYLDKYDEIDFDTRDEKTRTWTEIYNELTSLSAQRSLELAFEDMARALDGRGESWVLISPVQGNRYSGIYSRANRNSILALVNFVDSLEIADVYFENSKTRFKDSIMALDGAD
ncbi:MAG: hypothetical protein ACQETH_00170 [Candidatus Rifleibacteriota bacterium]